MDLFAGEDKEIQAAKLQNLEKVIRAMPVVSVSHKIFVEGETTITAMDIITF